MKILKNEATFEILSKTEDVIWQIANVARTCYKSFNKQSKKNDLKLVQNLLNRNHFAMLEFGDLSVKFDNVSRGFSHEIVRHRIASYAQESTRYVDKSDLHVIVPPHKDENIEDDGIDDNFRMSVSRFFNYVQNFYKTLIKSGYKPEDARMVLPLAIEAPICIKANFREWLHIFDMRCDIYAHWEIRGVMLELLKWCQKNIPLIFDNYHFFTTADGKEYARRILSDFKIKDELTHMILSNSNKKEELIKYINEL